MESHTGIARHSSWRHKSDLEEMVYKTCIFNLTPPDSSPDTTFIQTCLLNLVSFLSTVIPVLTLVPFVSENHPDTIRYALENSLLTMSLRDYHLHCASDADDLFSLDFQLATGLWFTLKDISCTIQLAANPLLDPFGDLPGTLDPELLERIGMGLSPAVLSIEKYTQNLLIVMSTRAEVCRLFGIAQKSGSRWCSMDPDG